jgi:hypothetical protein
MNGYREIAQRSGCDFLKDTDDDVDREAMKETDSNGSERAGKRVYELGGSETGGVPVGRTTRRGGSGVSNIPLMDLFEIAREPWLGRGMVGGLEF